MNDKLIIYQILTRLFTNSNKYCVPNGTIEQNGCGKMNDITSHVLESIRSLGSTHVWYTGIIEHATKTDYSRFGIRPDNPYIVKGRAGSPYAIKDYYDIDPRFGTMEDMDRLIAEAKKRDMYIVMDLVVNHCSDEHEWFKKACKDPDGKYGRFFYLRDK